MARYPAAMYHFQVAVQKGNIIFDKLQVTELQVTELQVTELQVTRLQKISYSVIELFSYLKWQKNKRL